MTFRIPQSAEQLADQRTRFVNGLIRRTGGNFTVKYTVRYEMISLRERLARRWYRVRVWLAQNVLRVRAE